MNHSEIEFIEARLPIGLKPMPTDVELIGIVAQARRQRSRDMARLMVRFFNALADAVVQVRGIAAECTAARRRAELA